MSVLKNTINRMMSNNGEDIGLDRGGQRGRQRSINADGSFNMERKTGNIFGSFHLYQWLITTSWKHYWLSVGSFYFFANIFFGHSIISLVLKICMVYPMELNFKNYFIASFLAHNHLSQLVMEAFTQ